MDCSKKFSNKLHCQRKFSTETMEIKCFSFVLARVIEADCIRMNMREEEKKLVITSINSLIHSEYRCNYTRSTISGVFLSFALVLFAFCCSYS